MNRSFTALPRLGKAMLASPPVASVQALIVGLVLTATLLSAQSGGGATTAADRHLSYDAAKKTVHLVLNAGEGSANGGMNFNGGFAGNLTITVPKGWTVSWHFVNLDAIPHSAIILPDQQPFPPIPQSPAFSRAYTAHLTDGLPTNGSDDTTFLASQAGAYVIACGVPGHAPSGMWIRLVVSASASAPTYGR
jgi:sulfocyanin